MAVYLRSGDPAVIRPDFHWANRAYHLRPTPVDTTLHKYDRRRPNRYVTTGESITFRFPATYYYWKVNQAGGPQWDIALYIDPQDLSAMRPKLREVEPPLFGADRYSDEKRRAHLELSRRAMSLHILSPLTGNHSSIYSIDKGKFARTGEYCELEMYVDSTHRMSWADRVLWHEDRAGVMVPPPFSQAEIFVSSERVPRERYLDHMFEARCGLSLRFCTVHSFFESWQIRFHIRKERLCAWRDELMRIQAFLDQHAVSRTSPKIAVPHAQARRCRRNTDPLQLLGFPAPGDC